MMLRDRKQLGAVAAGEQKISALTRTAATLKYLGEAPESHTEQIGRPMARVAEPVSAGLGRSNLSRIGPVNIPAKFEVRSFIR